MSDEHNPLDPNADDFPPAPDDAADFAERYLDPAMIGGNYRARYPLPPPGDYLGDTPCCEEDPNAPLEFKLKGPPAEVQRVLDRLGGGGTPDLTALATLLGTAMGPGGSPSLSLSRPVPLALNMSFTSTPDEEDPLDGETAYTIEARGTDPRTGDVRFTFTAEGQWPVSPRVEVDLDDVDFGGDAPPEAEEPPAASVHPLDEV